MGNVIAYRQGRDAPEGQTRERVMLSAHMDEIGFIVRYIDDTGYLRLQALGGFDTRNLFARNVTVHTRTTTLPGILSPGGRPIHISTPEDRKKVPEMREFFVDLGLGVDDAKRQVRVGDMVTLDQTARQVGHLIVGKAMDDRASVYMQLEVLRRLDGKPRHDVYAVFSTQEEVGLRGAITAAYSVQPTIGVALDVTLAVDTPGVGPDEAVTRMGQGIGIKVYDSSMISTRWLVDDFADLADREGIPYQLEVLSLGGTDAPPSSAAATACPPSPSASPPATSTASSKASTSMTSRPAPTCCSPTSDELKRRETDAPVPGASVLLDRRKAACVVFRQAFLRSAGCGVSGRCLWGGTR